MRLLAAVLSLMLISAKWIGPPGANRIDGGISLTFELIPNTSLTLNRVGNTVMYAYESSMDGQALRGEFKVDEERVELALAEGTSVVAYREREQKQRMYLARRGR